MIIIGINLIFRQRRHILLLLLLLFSFFYSILCIWHSMRGIFKWYCALFCVFVVLSFHFFFSSSSSFSILFCAISRSLVLNSIHFFIYFIFLLNFRIAAVYYISLVGVSELVDIFVQHSYIRSGVRHNTIYTASVTYKTENSTFWFALQKFF